MTFSTRLLGFLCFESVLGSTISFTWDSKCTSSDAMAIVTDVRFKGNNLGEPITISGTGEFKQPANAGTTYTIVVSAMGVPLLSQTNDFCSDSVVNLPMGMGSINMKGLGCPVGVGAFSLDESLTLSSHMVFPKASVQLMAQDANKKQYFCVNLLASISNAEVEREAHSQQDPILYI